MKPADLALFHLDAEATLADLKRAYRQAALALHPDQNPDPAAAVRFRELTDAYRRLEGRMTRPVSKKRSPQDRAVWFVAEAQSLVKKWPQERWETMVDGLPASVWLAGALDVLARWWQFPVQVSETVPTDLKTKLDSWATWLTHHTLSPRMPRSEAKTLGDALDAAETRLKALTRPLRR
jgi:hypothetical protein